ncbi:ArsC family transcriptional regulator [Haloferula helveola]|uniref:ArsC family transcriptional regulator n=1 Tax=Haloferula helveola TaxID=490095 RepID=A0ABN6HFD9_9BACT|nr:ArsC family transcriptional regulator [Haloferula helveola]
MKVYAYKSCDSCRKAVRWLKDKGIGFEEIPIRETPPTRTELKTMLKAYGGDLRRLFNTAGGDYRSLGLKDRIATMTEDEAFSLLEGNGNLVKRPFAVGKGVALVGFRPDDWEKALA